MSSAPDGADDASAPPPTDAQAGSDALDAFAGQVAPRGDWADAISAAGVFSGRW
jgi:hypothetical protein